MLQQVRSSLVAVDDLSKPPWNSILAYPNGSAQICKARIIELRSLGIKKIEFSGSVQIGDVRILGKGCTSMVVKVWLDGKLVALKIRRVDSNRPGVARETRLQKLANKVGVGPQVFAHTKNFLAMELIGGTDIPTWVKNLKGKGSTQVLRNRIKDLLKQCFALDSIGLDHGEISNLRKHVLVDEKVTILDFETASQKRRVSNVTSAAQYLFIGGPVANTVRKRLSLKDVGAIIQPLREYKKEPSEQTFQNLLAKLKLV
ncbi:MAG: serine/threonine protein kinase [Thaumarchaeota archaeon]|nr:serine/threonine protein kinase [Nitrososphaerota archaeon]